MKPDRSLPASIRAIARCAMFAQRKPQSPSTVKLHEYVDEKDGNDPKEVKELKSLVEKTRSDEQAK